MHVTVLTGRSKEIGIETVNPLLKVVRMPYLDYPPRSVWFQLQNLRTILGYLMDQDVVHILEPRDSLILSHLLKRLEKPLVMSIHEVPRKTLEAIVRNNAISSWSMGDLAYQVLEYPLDNLAFRSSLRNADHIITFGLQTMLAIKETLQGRNLEVSLIHNGINFDEFKTEAKSQTKSPLVIFCGRLYLLKGVLHLIKAFSLVTKEIPTAELELFGDGPLKRKIQRLISELNLEEKVLLRGFVPHSHLIHEIQRADLMAHPSFIETGPFLAGLEAMACKRPLVGFNLPFMREFVHDGRNGLLVQTGNVDELAEKIVLLLSNPELCHKLGENAYEYVKNNHNWDILVHEYIRLYDDTVSRGKR